MSLPERKINRLSGYDYSQNGGYFITICVHNKKRILSPTIGTMVGWLKYQTTKQINLLRDSVGERVWQRSYYDHIIRCQQDYEEIWRYIDENPLRWLSDRLF